MSLLVHDYTMPCYIDSYALWNRTVLLHQGSVYQEDFNMLKCNISDILTLTANSAEYMESKSC